LWCGVGAQDGAGDASTIDGGSGSWVMSSRVHHDAAGRRRSLEKADAETRRGASEHMIPGNAQAEMTG
jgi:hypothetical protein